MNKKMDGKFLYAAEKGDSALCAASIAKGADIHAVSEWGMTALHLAVAGGCIQTCRFLIEKGVDVNAVDSGKRTALHLAVQRGQIQTCVTLLTHGANPLLRNNIGQNAHDLATSDCACALRAWVSSQAARTALQEITAATTPPGP